jgi:glutamyl-tRNA reductase
VSFEIEHVDVVQTIVSLQDYFETIRQTEVHRVRRRLRTLSQEQELAIEALTRGIVNKIMHPPISALKTAARESDATNLMQLLKRIFNLDELNCRVERKMTVPAENLYTPEQTKCKGALAAFP